MHPVKDEEPEEEGELDGKLDHSRDHDRHGYAEPGEVNFSEDSCVADKRRGRADHAIRKVRPAGDTGQIKEQRRQTVRGKFRHLSEDDRKDNGGDKRLENMPEWTKNRLLILSHEIAPHEHRCEVAIPPQVSEVQIEPPGLRPNDQVPLFGS